MPDAHITTPLVDITGKRGLIVGIAAGCAEAFALCGTKLAATFLNAKAEPFVRTVTDLRAPGTPRPGSAKLQRGTPL